MHINGGINTEKYWNCDVSKNADISPLALSVTLSAYGDKIIVKEGDWVSVGEPLTKNMKAHSSVSGKVVSAHSNSITIENDKHYNLSNTIRPFNKRLSDASCDDLLEYISKLGIITDGQFLYDSIISRPENTKVLLVSCSDTLPYISNEHHNILNSATQLVYGAKILAKALSATSIVFCLEKRYKKTYIDFINNIKKQRTMDVMIHSSKYPADKKYFLSKQFASANRKCKFRYDDFFYVKGSVCSELFESFKTGCPVVRKNIVINGPISNNPCNVNVPIGTSIEEILRLTDNNLNDNTKIILDNSVNGKPATVDSFIDKSNTAILLCKDESQVAENASCISCNLCHKACPANLFPAKFVEGNSSKVHKCIDCGCCTYVCPSKIDIRSFIIKLRQEKEANNNEK